MTSRVLFTECALVVVLSLSYLLKIPKTTRASQNNNITPHISNACGGAEAGVRWFPVPYTLTPNSFVRRCPDNGGEAATKMLLISGLPISPLGNRQTRVYRSFWKGAWGETLFQKGSPQITPLSFKEVSVMKIRIKIGNLSMDAELNDSRTAKKIAEALPIQASFNTWGDEIYFTIAVAAPLEESAREVVELGDLGYWPQGAAFCIFFGLTPISSPGKIVPASAVNIIGRVLGDPNEFKGVMHERQVVVEAA